MLPDNPHQPHTEGATCYSRQSGMTKEIVKWADRQQLKKGHRTGTAFIHVLCLFLKCMYYWYIVCRSDWANIPVVGNGSYRNHQLSGCSDMLADNGCFQPIIRASDAPFILYYNRCLAVATISPHRFRIFSYIATILNLLCWNNRKNAVSKTL